MKESKLIKFLNEVKFPIIISVIFLLFKSTIENLAGAIIVTPFLSKIEIGILSDIVFIISVISIFYFVIVKLINNYFVSNKFLFVSLIITTFYIYYRIENNICEYYGLHFFESIKLLDIIPLISIGLIVIKVFHKGKHEQENNKSGFFLDTPLGKEGIDLLKREDLAKHIASEIVITDSPESSFAIGISSEWGFGKTSFLDMLERNLDKKSNIIIKINPWINHDSRNIIKDFFRALSSELAKYNSEISPLLKKYTEILIGVSNGSLNSFFNSLIHTNENETISNEFIEIDSAIKKINKKIIVFIDDLDRLYEKEIIQVVKLIRNSANFGNTVFIVAYDRNYIVNAIKLINNYTPELFLEKIFQLEIRLPNFENHIIQKRIYELLSSRVTEEDKNELISVLLKKTRRAFKTNLFHSDSLTTLRDATRFSNSFLIAYNYLKGEIVLTDLLNLEVLRLKYSSIYKLIFFQSEDFLTTKSIAGNKTVYNLRKKSDNNLNSNNNDSENYELLIRTYIEKNHEKLGVSESDIDKAIQLLYSLFPDSSNIFYRDESKLLSISNPSSFDRYSHYRLLDTNVSEIEFSKFRLKPIDEFQTKIEEWIKKGLRWELKTRFEEIKEFSDKTDFEKIIKAIFHLARVPQVKLFDNDYTGFDFDNLYNKLSKSEKYLDLHYYESVEDYKNFIISIFEEAQSPFTFEIDFIYWIFNNFSISYDFIVPKEKIDDIRLNYFKTYLNEVEEVDNNVWNLYHSNDVFNVTPQGGGYSVEKIKKPEANETYIEFIKTKALNSFLVDIIDCEPFNKKTFALSSIIPKMFGSLEAFGKFLDELSENDYSYLKEFMEFFEKFKEKDYKTYVPFDFKIIPIKKR